MTVDIVCAAYNGERFIPELLRSMQAQTHAEWRLWVRDDGSTDSTIELVASVARTDGRIHLLDSDEARLGSTGSFGWLLDHLPSDAAYIMCADQDDVWLPRKIETTLAAMLKAEATSAPGTPVLVHTDLVVVDERLNEIHPSFWAFTALAPEPPTLRRYVVRTAVTGAALMVNGALLGTMGRIPAEAVQHDWWMACVAAAFGRVVAVPEATILYRQHGANQIGAEDRRISLARLPGAVAATFRSKQVFREFFARSARQAQAFLCEYGDRLSEADRRFVEDFSRLADQPSWRRKLAMLRLSQPSDRTVLRALGILVRA